MTNEESVGFIIRGNNMNMRLDYDYGVSEMPL
jgi:hypothetical protein